MALFSRKKQQTPVFQQPHPDWPWRLTESGASTADFAWADIVRGLDALAPEQGSFLILEQSGPDGQYWFLQSAIALKGPHAGQYIVGCGYSGPKGPVLLEHYCGPVNEAVSLFADVWRGQGLDLSGFEDHSAWLPANS